MWVSSWGWSLHRCPLPETQGCHMGGVLSDWASSWCRFLYHMILFKVLLNPVSYFNNNFQRRMPRFEQRWRAQRSVISVVNCRIPWTNRDLNVYCAFGISLKAYLLQCLYHLFLTAWTSLGVLAPESICVSGMSISDAWSVSVAHIFNQPVKHTRCIIVVLRDCAYLFSSHLAFH